MRRLFLARVSRLIFIITAFSCSCSSNSQTGTDQERRVIVSIGEKAKAIVGAERTAEYFPLLEGKTIAVVANQTSMVSNVHLVDTLFNTGFKIKSIFSPEHGFRGETGAGERVDNKVDKKTGLPIVSLYGKNKKPTAEQLKDVDIVIFDIQDVGARFYTYISTMHYVMEACAENNKELIILDRPNPNGHYVDGPVLEDEYRSFVGMHPVPIVHGMTVGEYAQMINGEEWLKDSMTCRLQVIKCENWDHKSRYVLPIKPSPNLPNMSSVYLYPSLCLFEGTVMSIGRGTDLPFQVVGHPDFSIGSFTFTPKSIPGVVANPKFMGQTCYGENLQRFGEYFVPNTDTLNLTWLIGSYELLKNKTTFFTSFFTKLAGTGQLQKQIEAGVSLKEIRKSWQPELDKFKSIRKKYLLYTDFE